MGSYWDSRAEDNFATSSKIPIHSQEPLLLTPAKCHTGKAISWQSCFCYGKKRLDAPSCPPVEAAAQGAPMTQTGSEDPPPHRAVDLTSRVRCHLPGARPQQGAQTGGSEVGAAAEPSEPSTPFEYWSLNVLTIA